MRIHVTFGYPAEFVDAEDGEGIPGIGGVQWFLDTLRRVSDLRISDDLVQEDWGVAINARRGQAKFWIGLSAWDADEWNAHFHHDALFQRFSHAGKSALQCLIIDFHGILVNDPSISKITWYKDTSRGMDSASGRPTPDEE